MREIGGYIELDTYHLPMLHEDAAVALNCARNALAYLLRARKIRRLWVPKLICSSVTDICSREGVPYSLYGIGMDLLPSEEVSLGDGEWFYFVNYYSQFSNEQIKTIAAKYGRVIVDNVQSYFQAPVPHVDTIYTCRKYFGVPDGAFLYTDAELTEELPTDVSFERMRHLLGRFEETASDHYREYTANEEALSAEPIKRMSALTNNLLRGIDYKRVKAVRERNYRFLQNELGGLNRLDLCDRAGTFMYPLLLENGAEIRKKLQERKIYVPTLWPDVFQTCSYSDTEYFLAGNILPLPVDQRYSLTDIQYMAREVVRCTSI